MWGNILGSLAGSQWEVKEVRVARHIGAAFKGHHLYLGAWASYFAVSMDRCRQLEVSALAVTHSRRSPYIAPSYSAMRALPQALRGGPVPEQVPCPSPSEAGPACL